jgi:hypothetical protein
MSERFDDRLAEIWSTHFGCRRQDLALPGTLLVSRERLTDTGAIHVVHLWARACAEVDPQLRADLDHLLAQRGNGAILTAELLKASVPAERLLSADRGFIFHLEPGHLIVRRPEPPITLRPLTESDQPALLKLIDRCPPGEVDDASIEIDHEITCGCFEGLRMVAAASGYRRSGFMDLGVLTDPSFRGRRLAPAMVAALSRDAEARNFIAMYRCDQANRASKRVAEASGFTQYFETESLTLALA